MVEASSSFSKKPPLCCPTSPATKTRLCQTNTIAEIETRVKVVNEPVTPNYCCHQNVFTFTKNASQTISTHIISTLSVNCLSRFLIFTSSIPTANTFSSRKWGFPDEAISELGVQGGAGQLKALLQYWAHLK